MAYPTAVNSQITDSVTQANVQVLGEAPAQALSAIYQTLAHSVGIAMENAVSAQQQMNIILQATTTQGVALIYSIDAAIAQRETSGDAPAAAAELKSVMAAKAAASEASAAQIPAGIGHGIGLDVAQEVMALQVALAMGLAVQDAVANLRAIYILANASRVAAVTLMSGANPPSGAEELVNIADSSVQNALSALALLRGQAQAEAKAAAA